MHKVKCAFTMFTLDNIHSLTDFRRNAGNYAEQIRQKKTPMVLTVNGEAALVVHDALAFQELLNRLQQFEKELAQIKLEKLRAELVKGENSGKSMPLDLDAIEQEALAELEAGDLEVDPKLRSTL
ncbi:MAG TPA: prevent-host-death family protein [Cyanobacteria bacterium UBA8553]|nr:prevent-host-death family protein [Cyanobacteria bacterium UBA8553]